VSRFRDGPSETKVEVLGDSAYGTGEMLDSLEKAGRKATIKPWPIRPAVPDGFTIDDFTYDDEAGTLTCPNGVARTLTRKRNVVFGAVCRNCPLRDKCTTSASGRTVHVHRHEKLQRRHRQRAQDPAFQHTYRAKRPLVERSIAWLTRGNRRVPYRGIAKNNAWLHQRIAALNLRRLLALGLVIENGGWQIG
jgi:IS5 family transposase